MEFTDASKIKTRPPILIGLTGMSNGGKTFSALLLARALAKAGGGDVIGVDTEGGRMAKYGSRIDYPELTPYKMTVLKPPFDGYRIMEAIDHAEKEMAACLVIDSMTDEWEGEGGVLDSKDDFMKDRKESYEFVAWKKAKLPHQKLHNRLLTAQIPIIMCFRAREKIKVKGSSVEKLGVQPICDSRMIYDFTFCLHMDEEKQDGSYRLIKSGYRHERSVFPKNGKIDEQACQRLSEMYKGKQDDDLRQDSYEPEKRPAQPVPPDTLWIRNEKEEYYFNPNLNVDLATDKALYLQIMKDIRVAGKVKARQIVNANYHLIEDLMPTKGINKIMETLDKL